jgi:hypothetical protein
MFEAMNIGSTMQPFADAERTRLIRDHLIAQLPDRDRDDLIAYLQNKP